MLKVIGFHNPDEGYGFLSNWYMCEFDKDDVHYTSMEQYMMHQKALIFDAMTSMPGRGRICLDLR